MQQQTFSFSNTKRYRPTIKLSEIEQKIRKERIIVPCPSRTTLQHLCEDGTFDTVGDKPTSFGWLVYEDSFYNWINSLGIMDLAA